MFKINTGSFEGRKEIETVLKNNELSFDKNGPAINEGMEINIALNKEKSGSIVVEGTIKGNITVSCSRCLEDFVAGIDTDFLSVFKDRKNFTDDDKDTDVIMFENNEIDLAPLLKETIILELPMKPLCRQGCKGLCPVCGKNLNNESCKCEKNLKISPFDKLDELKIKDKE